MQKNALIYLLALTTLTASSCGGSKPSAASIAQQWCDLNGKAYKAQGPAKEAALAAKATFEKEMEAKYKSDNAFMALIEKEVEKCEDASEGR
jgi:hypothetical protein